MCDCCPDAADACPDVVTDWASGDVVCRRCGVVVEGHILDESPEWHNREHDAFDKSRVGQAARPHGPQALNRLGTYLAMAPASASGSAAPAAPARVKRLAAAACREDPRDVALAEGLRLVERLVGDMGLSTSGVVATTAKDLFADLSEARAVRSDCRRALAAAAVYYAFKLQRADRELRQVSQVCDVGGKALNAAVSEYKEALRDKPYYPRLFAPLQAGRLIDVFLDRLRLQPPERKRVWRAATQLDEQLVHAMDCGRKPRTICSGLLYLATRQEAGHVTKKSVAEACSVCQQTLDKVVAQIKACLVDAAV
jgi:transcription initiation factor TFIIB